MSDWDWKNWMRDNWFWVLVYSFITIYFLAEFLSGMSSGNALSWSHFKSSLSVPVMLLVCAVFVQVFTTPIQLPMPENANYEQIEKNRIQLSMQRRNWMILAYGFMLVSLLVPIYIFSWGWDSGEKANELAHVKHPIAIFLGCSNDNGDKELSCFPGKQTTASQNNKDNANSSGLGVNINAAGVPMNSAWVLNVGGHVIVNANDVLVEDSGSYTVYQVRGGLLVPLYVIIIALMGGSISLTRRLPEYQKRANPEYIPTAKEPRLSQHEFREYLAFQLIQFISAPFLAIVAYYILKPDNTPAAVVMAFAAGFTSESVLLMIRLAADKIIPTTSTEHGTGTISGVVVCEDASGNIVPIKDAEVALSTASQIRALTDEYGGYVLSGISVGEHGLVVKASCNSVKREAAGSVKIASPQEVVKYNCVIKINP